VSPAGFELLTRAVSRGDAAAAAAFRPRCTLDTARTRPRVFCTALSPDTIRQWRSSLERLGAAEGAPSDSAGALGVMTLAALDRASARPDQQRTPARGLLKRTAQGVRLTGCDPPIAVTGDGADSLATEAGTDVWMWGACRGPSTLEWIGGHVIGRPPLDLFVMGLCPYARKLEAQMSEDMARLGPARVPEIAVHYLLYWDDEGPERRVGSAHGQAERIEDAVQILIRDEHPAQFWRYLTLRSKADVPWEILAQKSGIGWQDIGKIQRRVARDLDQLLLAEHTFNLRNFAHVDGSPTLFWQGAPAQSIAVVPGFTPPAEEKEKCHDEESGGESAGR